MKAMTLNRDYYIKKKHDIISTQNEPGHDMTFNVNARMYPDMYEIYDRFKTRFNLRLNEFVLSNGAENALKNCLLAMHPDALWYATPTWGMVDVICAALDIRRCIKSFYIKDNYVHEPAFDEIDHKSMFYTTYKRSNIFKFVGIDLYEMSRRNTIVLDVSYCNEAELHQLLLVPRQNKNIVVIGSFDKLAGCGLRFGFCVYNLIYNNHMQLQREQFLNSMVEDFVINKNFQYDQNSKYYQKLTKLLCEHDTLTYNYITVLGSLNVEVPMKIIYVDGVKFTRIGFPYDDDELSLVCNALNNRNAH